MRAASHGGQPLIAYRCTTDLSRAVQARLSVEYRLIEAVPVKPEQNGRERNGNSAGCNAYPDRERARSGENTREFHFESLTEQTLYDHASRDFRDESQFWHFLDAPLV